jgi:NitT/TauT family transport system substrate-binding protein
MPMTQDRRQFLATSLAGAWGAVGLCTQPASAEPPPETTRIRLSQIAGICVAPQYVAEELLKIEGFSDVQYVEFPTTNPYPAFASGEVDLSMAFVAPFVIQVDKDAPIVLLGGVHVGCFELFGTERIRAIRDLKGKTVAVPELGSAHYVFVASLAAHVGVDPRRDINFVFHPPAESIQLLADEKIDALMGFPPTTQELRARKIGHVIMNSRVDRPWSQYFCCIVAANQEFVRKHPVATKRALRAILKAADFCAAEPERAARAVAGRGYRYEYALQTMREIRYAQWQEYDVEDTVRFYALRLHDVGMIKSSPRKIIAQGTDWRFFDQLKRELKG